jgi:hypothetical protein
VHIDVYACGGVVCEQHYDGVIRVHSSPHPDANYEVAISSGGARRAQPSRCPCPCAGKAFVRTEVCNYRSRLAQGTCVPAALLAPVLGSTSTTNAAGVADMQCAARQQALAFITSETKKQAPALALVNRVCVCVCVRERERDRENERERA